MSQLSTLDVSELDFDTIKRNLKTFLQAQDQFSDYDFEGSGLSVGSNTVTLTLALALLIDEGVYPKCFAIEIADDLFTAESKNISFNNILPR